MFFNTKIRNAAHVVSAENLINESEKIANFIIIAQIFALH